MDGKVVVGGDTLLIGTDMVVVESIDTANMKLLVNRSISWQSGEPVHYYGYNGTAPDVGAIELGDEWQSLRQGPELSHGMTPSVFSILSNGPFVTVRYQVAQNGLVQLSAFNPFGQAAGILFDGSQEKGLHDISWNAKGMQSGCYFLRLTTEEGGKTKQIVKKAFVLR